MRALVYLLLNAVAVMISSSLIPGVVVESFFNAVVVGVLLGICNILLKPVLILLTLPINILTLGIFTLVINGLIVLLVSFVVPGFHVNSLLSAVLFSLLLSFISSFFNWIQKED